MPTVLQFARSVVLLVVVLSVVVWCPAAPVAQTPAPHLVTIVAVDVSASQASAAQRCRMEVKQLIDNLPDDATVAVLAVGGSVREMFEGTLEPARRTAVRAVVDALPFNSQNTALAEALAQATSILARISGSRRDIWIFSDGQNRPVPGSRFRGRSFQEVLDAFALPGGEDLHIRIYGPEPLTLVRSGIFIHRTAPDWPVVYRRAAAPPPPPVVIPTDNKPNLAGLLITAGVVACGVFGVIRWWRTSKRADLLRTTPSTEIDETDPASTMLDFTRYNILADGIDEQVSVDPISTQEVLVGDDLTADLLLPECDGGLLRFRVNPDVVPPWLSITNEGSQDVLIGRCRIRPSVTQRVPSEPLEIRSGRQILHVFPEIVRRTEQAGEPVTI